VGALNPPGLVKVQLVEAVELIILHRKGDHKITTSFIMWASSSANQKDITLITVNTLNIVQNIVTTSFFLPF
jgi:hypothetical protein